MIHNVMTVPDASVNARKWEIQITGTRAVLTILDDAHTRSDTLELHRVGAEFVSIKLNGFELLLREG